MIVDVKVCHECWIRNKWARLVSVYSGEPDEWFNANWGRGEVNCRYPKRRRIGHGHIVPKGCPYMMEHCLAQTKRKT